MSDFSFEQLQELLRVAEKRPLTEAEQAMLRELLAQEEGQLAASAHQHLQTHYVADGQERRWSAQEMREVTAIINQKASQRVHYQRRQNRVRQIAWVTAAVAILIGFLLLESLFSQPVIEPAIQPSPTATTTPTATPEPTPTLRPGYVYTNLMTAVVQNTDVYTRDLYSLTVPEAAAQWDSDLYLPSQMPDTWTFVGAAVDEANGVLELAFVQTAVTGDTGWVLSQAPTVGRDIATPLPVSYQPLPRIDDTNVYEDRETAVGPFTVHAYQYEYVYHENGQTTWTVYNTVTWQQVAQLLTLTMIDDNLRGTIPIAAAADGLQMRLMVR
jgi:hypothetical protein